MRNTSASLLTALLLTGCGSSYQFRNVEVVESRFDPEAKATHVTLSFEVWDGELPVQDLREAELEIIEDGHPATSESVRATSPELIRLPVTLVIDTSHSMYHAGAVDSIKRAASRFVSALEHDGYPVRVLQFARTVQELDRVDDIRGDGEFAEVPEDERWTSLYAAVQVALEMGEDDVVVVFSDGADNYSHNIGGHELTGLEEMIVDARRQVHVIGFGSVKEQHDRKGIKGWSALKRMSVYGTHQYANTEDAFENVFDFLARRMRNVYTFDYFSPNLDGEHELVVRATRRGKSGRSKPVVVDMNTAPRWLHEAEATSGAASPESGAAGPEDGADDDSTYSGPSPE